MMANLNKIKLEIRSQLFESMVMAQVHDLQHARKNSTIFNTSSRSPIQTLSKLQHIRKGSNLMLSIFRVVSITVSGHYQYKPA